MEGSARFREALAATPAAAFNNPGGLKVPGSDRLQSFASLHAGIAAQEALLERRYFGRGLNTVSSIINTYAPSSTVGGDNTPQQVANYIAYVSRRLGVNPNDALSPALIPQLGEAMREFETGRRAF